MKTIDMDSVLAGIQLQPSNLAVCAEWKKKFGKKVIYSNGVYWEHIHAGFYQPIHFLQKLAPGQIKFPCPFCWGARGVLEATNVSQANGLVNYYTLENLASFNLGLFPQKRRENIRKCFKRLEIREIKDVGILYDQGYDVLKSSLERTRYKKIISKKDYLKQCHLYVNTGDNSHLVLGAFHDNKLVAYDEIFAVENTAYMMNMMIASDALKHGASAGLFFTQHILAQRSPQISEIYGGGFTPSDPSLDDFKQSMGLVVKSVPALCIVMPPLGFLLHRFCKYKYNQLYGMNLSAD